MNKLHFAVGDIHGRYDKLVKLLDNIQEVALRMDRLKYTVVFLGDYVDRGPESHRVIARLRKLTAHDNVADRNTYVALKGNHEDLFEKAFGGTDEELGARMVWLQNGGKATLNGYLAHYGEDWIGQAKSHFRWMRRLPTSYVAGNYAFCHAGVDPTRPFDEQTDEDLTWIRKEPIREVPKYEYHVVYGHTPTRSGLPEQSRCGTNVDTGAYVDERPLTAAVILIDEKLPVGYITHEYSVVCHFDDRPKA